MTTRYLKNDEIDFEKWDACIQQSPNGLIYGFSYYLDNISDNWDAIVYGDYEAILPLPWNTRIGIRSIYPPFFAQQLGIFSKIPLQQSLVDEMFAAIPAYFRRIQLYLNSSNDYKLKNFKRSKRVNYELSLNDSYENLKSKFSKNTLRNLKKAEKANLSLLSDQGPEQLIEMAKLEVPHALSAFIEKDLQCLIRVMYKSIHQGLGQILSVVDSQNRICAQGFFLSYGNRIINLFPVTSSVGRQNGAMFSIINRLILDNCGTNFTLDLEGSMDPNVARFYRGFGSTERTYYFVQKSSLPFYLKPLLRLKKI